jgi:hypothetical protein
VERRKSAIREKAQREKHLSDDVQDQRLPVNAAGNTILLSSGHNNDQAKEQSGK